MDGYGPDDAGPMSGHCRRLPREHPAFLLLVVLEISGRRRGTDADAESGTTGYSAIAVAVGAARCCAVAQIVRHEARVLCIALPLRYLLFGCIVVAVAQMYVKHATPCDRRRVSVVCGCGPVWNGRNDASFFH